MTYIGMNHCTVSTIELPLPPYVSKPRPLRHENQPGLPDFSAYNTEKYREAWIYTRLDVVDCSLTSGGSLLLGGSPSIELLRLAGFSSLTRFASGGGIRFRSDSLLVLLWECPDPDANAVLNRLMIVASKTRLSSQTLTILLVDFNRDSSLLLSNEQIITFVNSKTEI